MDKVPNSRTKRSVGLLLAFSGFLLITFISMSYAQEYGYRLAQDAVATVWWAEGAYKVKKDEPPPRKNSTGIRLVCARNEYEPFILIFRPKQRMDDIRVEISPLQSRKGVESSVLEVSLCRVEWASVFSLRSGTTSGLSPARPILTTSSSERPATATACSREVIWT
jgi:hypothetical protein